MEKRLLDLSVQVVEFGINLRKDPLYWSITDQLIRSTTSIGANFIEAKAASSTNDYVRFLQYALKSANESIYWLSIVKKTTPVHVTTIMILTTETKEISLILGKSIVTLKSKKT